MPKIEMTIILNPETTEEQAREIHEDILTGVYARFVDHGQDKATVGYTLTQD